MMRFQTSVINGYLAWMLVGVQMQIMAVLLCMHSGFPTKMVEQTIMTSLNDMMRILSCVRGREL